MSTTTLCCCRRDAVMGPRGHGPPERPRCCRPRSREAHRVRRRSQGEDCTLFTLPGRLRHGRQGQAQGWAGCGHSVTSLGAALGSLFPATAVMVAVAGRNAFLDSCSILINYRKKINASPLTDKRPQGWRRQTTPKASPLWSQSHGGHKWGEDAGLSEGPTTHPPSTGWRWGAGGTQSQDSSDCVFNGVKSTWFVYFFL